MGEFGGGAEQLALVQRRVELLLHPQVAQLVLAADQRHVAIPLRLFGGAHRRERLALLGGRVLPATPLVQGLPGLLLGFRHVRRDIGEERLAAQPAGIAVDAPGGDQRGLATDHLFQGAGLGLGLPGVETGGEFFGDAELRFNLGHHYPPIFMKVWMDGRCWNLQRSTCLESLRIHMLQRYLG